MQMIFGSDIIITTCCRHWCGFFPRWNSKTSKSYHITNEETTPLVKRRWYIKSVEKKTLKKPIDALKLSICRSGGPGIWAVMFCRCLAIQVMFKGILKSLTHTGDCGLKPAPWNSILSWVLFYRYDYSTLIMNWNPELCMLTPNLYLPL